MNGFRHKKHNVNERKVIRSDRGGEYYGRYDETGQNPGPFAKFLQKHGFCA